LFSPWLKSRLRRDAKGTYCARGCVRVWPLTLNVDDINPSARSGLRRLKSWSPEPRDHELPASCALSFISDIPSRRRLHFPSFSVDILFSEIAISLSSPSSSSNFSRASPRRVSVQLFLTRVPRVVLASYRAIVGRFSRPSEALSRSEPPLIFIPRVTPGELVPLSLSLSGTRLSFSWRCKVACLGTAGTRIARTDAVG